MKQPPPNFLKSKTQLISGIISLITGILFIVVFIGVPIFRNADCELGCYIVESFVAFILLSIFIVSSLILLNTFHFFRVKRKIFPKNRFLNSNAFIIIILILTIIGSITIIILNSYQLM